LLSGVDSTEQSGHCPPKQQSNRDFGLKVKRLARALLIELLQANTMLARTIAARLTLKLHRALHDPEGIGDFRRPTSSLKYPRYVF